MIQIDNSGYDTIKPLLKTIQSAKWFIERIKNGASGKIYIDRIQDMKSAFMVTDSSEYFFGGEYNELFLTSAIDYIISNIVPDSDDKIGFFYGSSELWKNGIMEKLGQYKDERFGQLLTRHFCRLDLLKFQESKHKLKQLEEGYQLTFVKGDSPIVSVTYNSEEIAYCRDNGQALGIMDLDVYVNPNHRNKGLAQICCTELIDYCLQHEMIPQWGCWDINKASCNLYKKIGFELYAKEQVILANFDIDNN